MKKRIRRKYLEEFCESRGYSDQCDGCVLENKDVSCAFSTASDEEIEKMCEIVKEEYK